jgi:glycosyltransferase involved in cell wall biosynthesis
VKISIYTFVKDGLFYDFHVAAMLRHHLPLADEIVVNEGFSTDGTFEAILGIDPKVKIHRSRWDQSNPDTWHRDFKNRARELCTGDWCILLDCDEFIPEWEFDRLRSYLAAAETSIVPVKFVHFYGNYKVYLATLPQIIPLTGMRIHRNIPEIEVWGDGANVRFRDREYDASTVAQSAFDVHHFGTVRNPARLRQKWRTQARQHDARNPRWDKVPSLVFNMFPHQWKDPDFLDKLAIYDPPYIKAVRDDPAEFTRDDFWLYEHLKRQPTGGSGTR